MVNEAVSNEDVGRLFAVVHLKAHQRKVTQDDIITVPTHIAADIGERIRLEKVTKNMVSEVAGIVTPSDRSKIFLWGRGRSV